MFRYTCPEFRSQPLEIMGQAMENDIQTNRPMTLALFVWHDNCAPGRNVKGQSVHRQCELKGHKIVANVKRGIRRNLLLANARVRSVTRICILLCRRVFRYDRVDQGFRLSSPTERGCGDEERLRLCRRNGRRNVGDTGQHTIRCGKISF